MDSLDWGIVGLSFKGDGVKQLSEFLDMESTPGILLMVGTILALVLANSPLGGSYAALLALPFEIRVGGAGIAKPLVLWINDGLMAIFFLQVGLELKRELLEGHLSSIQRAVLPAFGALGGLAVPATIYLLFNWGNPAARSGWAIPTATDIAFALGVLALLGSRVPAGLKAFLLSVAIFDDLAAIIIIAAYYTAEVALLPLGIAAIVVAGLALLNRAGVTRSLPYLALGLVLWVAVLKSGVHATLAGVVLAMTIPARAAKGREPLLPRLEHAIHPAVVFVILPIFAFANAGVVLRGLTLADLAHPVPLGIITGLFVGKQVGIMLICWVVVRVGLAALPAGVRWRDLYGTALLCGIGFTMSIFIGSLAFDASGGDMVPGIERLGILLGSLLAGLAGYLSLRWSLRRDSTA